MTCMRAFCISSFYIRLVINNNYDSYHVCFAVTLAHSILNLEKEKGGKGKKKDSLFLYPVEFDSVLPKLSGWCDIYRPALTFLSPLKKKKSASYICDK